MSIALDAVKSFHALTLIAKKAMNGNAQNALNGVKRKSEQQTQAEVPSERTANFVQRADGSRDSRWPEDAD
jgi:hypothetical protein